MLTNLSIRLIRIYQKIPGPWHGCCRFYPTCSQYAVIALSYYGFWKGWFLAIRRILRCHPFGKFGYDPVPISKKKRNNS